MEWHDMQIRAKLEEKDVFNKWSTFVKQQISSYGGHENKSLELLKHYPVTRFRWPPEGHPCQNSLFKVDQLRERELG